MKFRIKVQWFAQCFGKENKEPSAEKEYLVDTEYYYAPRNIHVNDNRYKDAKNVDAVKRIFVENWIENNQLDSLRYRVAVAECVKITPEEFQSRICWIRAI